jgi:DNA repair protein RecN (Recombination protein N)
MLQRLYIKDVAIIDELNLEFGAGLNIITGETGAGKSILMGAVGLLLGDRAKSDMVRQGAQTAVVEGWFDVPTSLFSDLLSESFDIQEDGLILRREVLASGKSRCFVNDSPVPLALLSAIGDVLVDLHGQHEHQNLLRVDRHLSVLDAFCGDDGLLSDVRESYKRCRAIEEELLALHHQETQYRQQRDLLEFQAQEIEKAAPRPDEEEALERDERLLQNSERIVQTAKQLAGMLYEDEGSVSERLAAASGLLSGLDQADPAFGMWAKEAESARITVEETVRAVESYSQKIEFNPQRLEDIRERLSLFGRLKKKYGGSMQNVLAFLEDARAKLGRMDTVGGAIRDNEALLEGEKNRFSGFCAKLSGLRRKTASELQLKIAVALAELGLKNGVFEVRIWHKPHPEGLVLMDGRTYLATAQGVDSVEFFVSLNPGEEPKPLAQVASGGEISRIMLALKTVLAEADRIPVLIFDEIDTGISGRTARVVGNNLKEVSRKHQVLCITHLAQIASLADSHFCVEKDVVDNRSRTRVRPLGKDERVAEIAKLIGGETVTESALQSARELLSV